MRVYVNNQGTSIINADFADTFMKNNVDKKRWRETLNDETEELKMSVRIAEMNHKSNPCVYTEKMLQLAKNKLRGK